jgi:hypothetical protein
VIPIKMSIPQTKKNWKPPPRNAVYSNHFKDSNNKPAPRVVYEKRINGIYYVVEAVPDSKAKKLQAVSVYKTKAKSGGWQEPGVRSPQAHVRNELAATANNNISDSPKNVNTQNKKNSRTTSDILKT